MCIPRSVVLGVACLVFTVERAPITRAQDQASDKKADEKKASDTKKARVVVIEIEVKGGTQALPEANVRLSAQSGLPRQSSTDSKGIAQFSNISPGKIAIDVTGAPGFEPAHQELEVSEDKRISIVLNREGGDSSKKRP